MSMTKTLSDVMRDLSHGVLSNLSIGSEGIGEIDDENQERVVSLINQGLARLHSRFMLSKKEITIQMIEGRYEYPLRLVHAESSDSISEKFIKDSETDPFEDDVIRVLKVFDAEGSELTVNSNDTPYGLITRKPNELKFEEVKDGETFRVLYQAGHKRLGVEDLTEEIVLPEPLYEALECYVGQRVLRAMNGQEHRAQGNDLLEMYEAICREIDEKDLHRESMTSANTKFEHWGFV
jgi:hypothetical protein